MTHREFTPKTGILIRAGEGVRRWWMVHGVTARKGGRVSRQRGHPSRDFSDLERVAALACSGYFHMGYVADPFVFMAEIPLKDDRCAAADKLSPESPVPFSRGHQMSR